MKGVWLLSIFGLIAVVTVTFVTAQIVAIFRVLGGPPMSASEWWRDCSANCSACHKVPILHQANFDIASICNSYSAPQWAQQSIVYSINIDFVLPLLASSQRLMVIRGPLTLCSPHRLIIGIQLIKDYTIFASSKACAPLCLKTWLRGRICMIASNVVPSSRISLIRTASRHISGRESWTVDQMSTH